MICKEMLSLNIVIKIDQKRGAGDEQIATGERNNTELVYRSEGREGFPDPLPVERSTVPVLHRTRINHTTEIQITAMVCPRLFTR